MFFLVVFWGEMCGCDEVGKGFMEDARLMRVKSG